MLGSPSSNFKKLSSDLWAISRLTATQVPTPKQAAVIHTARFIEFSANLCSSETPSRQLDQRRLQPLFRDTQPAPMIHLRSCSSPIISGDDYRGGKPRKKS